MSRHFRLLLVVPAVMFLAGCTSPLEPNHDTGEHPKDPPPDTNALFMEQSLESPILV